MKNISVSLIKTLRERTNISILECKKALIDSNGNIQLAIDYLRQHGLIKSAKKTGKITKEGAILIKIEKNQKYGVMTEINCETDFVSKNDKFLSFCHHVTNYAVTKKIIQIDILNNEFQDERNTLISIFDENINIRRVGHIAGAKISSYLHNKKIGAMISVTGKKINEQILKHIAMHIVANKPEYIDIHHIPIDLIDHEKKIQMTIALQSKKTYEIAKKITEGRINKFINEISLINQLFIMDTQKTIKDVLYENNIEIKKFIRFELGENIEKLT